MHADLQTIESEVTRRLALVVTSADLETLEQEYFSRKSGKLTVLLQSLKNLSPEERKTFGQELNRVKIHLESLLAQKRQELQTSAFEQLAQSEAVDITQPALPAETFGHIHPLTQVRAQMEAVCQDMGFRVEDGPELESDYYNFTALNIPPHHPARDSQDTFYIKDHPHLLMRSHVSNMQVRFLKTYGAPLRIAYPGRCFRNEATDARHEHTLYQFECMVIDRNINLSHMIGVIKEILKGLYKKDLKIRLRPKYYPFVEPGVNGEVTCLLCDGKGCRVCKYTGWLEIFGAGLVHPNVLREGGLNPNEYSGFAFGMGLTRMAMLKYGIEDARHLLSGDLRFLQQF